MFDLTSIWADAVFTGRVFFDTVIGSGDVDWARSLFRLTMRYTATPIIANAMTINPTPFGSRYARKATANSPSKIDPHPDFFFATN